MIQILVKAGLPPLTDKLRAADADNEQGYYEYEPVKQMAGADNSWMKLATGKVVKIISHLLPNLPAGYSYRIVFMLRNLGEVVASQDRMLRNRGERETAPVTNADLVGIFAAHLSQVRKWLSEQPNIEVVFVDYNQLVKDPQAALAPVGALLNLDLTKPEILAIVDPKYYRQRAG